MADHDLTERELALMAHAIGWPTCDRNRYITENRKDVEVLEGLCARGLARAVVSRAAVSGVSTFYLTNDGRALVEKVLDPLKHCQSCKDRADTIENRGGLWICKSCGAPIAQTAPDKKG